MLLSVAAASSGSTMLIALPLPISKPAMLTIRGQISMYQWARGAAAKFMKNQLNEGRMLTAAREARPSIAASSMTSTGGTNSGACTRGTIQDGYGMAQAGRDMQA